MRQEDLAALTVVIMASEHSKHSLVSGHTPCEQLLRDESAVRVPHTVRGPHAARGHV